MLHVPTLVRYKLWPIAHQIELVRGLLDDGVGVVLSGGPSARRSGAHRRGRAAASPRRRRQRRALLDVAGQLDFGQLVTLLRGAALYVGPDTSITHLAAACGTPLVALYGPVDPRLFGPWPQGHPATQPYVRHALRQQPPTPQGGGIVLLQGDAGVRAVQPGRLRAPQ